MCFATSSLMKMECFVILQSILALVDIDSLDISEYSKALNMNNRACRKLICEFRLQRWHYSDNNEGHFKDHNISR